jgi:hypothetical protein
MDISIAALSPEIAVESTQLKEFHNDPADQIIVATSRVLGISLLTSDRRILDFSDVETIWKVFVGLGASLKCGVGSKTSLVSDSRYLATT